MTALFRASCVMTLDLYFLGISHADVRHSSGRRGDCKRRRCQERRCHFNVHRRNSARPRDSIPVEHLLEHRHSFGHTDAIGDGIRAPTAAVHSSNRRRRNDLSHWGKSSRLRQPRFSEISTSQLKIKTFSFVLIESPSS